MLALTWNLDIRLLHSSFFSLLFQLSRTSFYLVDLPFYYVGHLPSILSNLLAAVFHVDVVRATVLPATSSKYYASVDALFLLDVRLQCSSCSKVFNLLDALLQSYKYLESSLLE